MGACASKPKVLEGNAPEKILASPVQQASNDAVGEEMKKEGGMVNASDDKRQSLGNLFKKDERGEDSEQVKGETSQTKQASEPQSDEVHDNFVDALIAPELEKAPEVASKIETPTTKISVEYTTEEVKKSETETPIEKKAEEAKSETGDPFGKKPEEVKSETGDPVVDKKTEEAKLETGDPVVKKTEEVKLEKEEKIEEKTGTEASGEKKGEEVKEAVETLVEKNIGENPITEEIIKSEAQIEKKSEEKAATETKKSGKFWWDK